MYEDSPQKPGALYQIFWPNLVDLMVRSAAYSAPNFLAPWVSKKKAWQLFELPRPANAECGHQGN